MEKFGNPSNDIDIETDTSLSNTLQTTETSAKKSTNNNEVEKDNYNCIACDKLREEVNFLQEKIRLLTEEMDDLKKDLSESVDREFYLADKVEKCQNEVQDLRELNLQWQRTGIEKHNNLLGKTF